MRNEIKKYEEKELVVFSVNIEQKQHKNGTWKKELHFPKNWEKFIMGKSYYNDKYNGLAMLTGKINNIIVIDIDNVEHWKNLLEENEKEEPKTVKVKSGNGGVHLYFKYSDDLDEIKSKSKCFGQLYDIDIRTNGGCIIIPPTKYYNKNLNNEVEYIWEKDIFDNELKKLPLWMKKLLLDKTKEKKKLKKENTQNINDTNDLNNKIIEINDLHNVEISQNEAELNFTIDDIETIVKMLSVNRCDNYNDWVNVGMCLYNLDQKYLLIWIKWSQQSEKYEDGACDAKWKTFKKNKDGLKIGSLLLWAKTDNCIQYEAFIKKKLLNKMIHSKYPNEKLILGDSIIVNDRCQYMPLKNRGCFIGGKEHENMPYSMYVDIIDKFMTIKCRYEECFGKTYPCQHILMNKNEMNVAFNGSVTININNSQDDELVEFQKINLFEDEELNELVYNSLQGEPSKLAEIIYYYYEDTFIYGEDEEWYIYENHKWKNIGRKNNKLRFLMEPKLKDLYSLVYNYYKDNESDKQKIKTLKNVMKTFGETTQKNNILTELIDIYLEKKNPNRDFTQKLDSNNYLIGFNNGVYDLQKFEFRDGKHNDYITLSVGYDYQENHTDKYDDLLKFIEDIQPNKEEREYMLTYLSIGLVGNLLELFTILTGCGRNGKSKLIELLKYTLGDYFGSVQSQLFTRPRPDANSPDPGLLSLSKKRIVIASEPEKNSKLNSGFIKFITGRDSTTLRNCHSNDMIDFTAKFITLLICNDIPECDDIDNAFSKRLRCINFPTEFVLDPKGENQKKMDVNINQNFDYWKVDFILLLIEYYKKYMQTKQLSFTENILKWTNQYKEDTDMYLQFINENLEKTESEKDKILCTTLYETFKIWFKNNNPNAKIPSSKEFNKSTKKYVAFKNKIRIGDKTQAGIEGYKLCDNE
jgi:P4 family phage/plasmid primase-like protien